MDKGRIAAAGPDRGAEGPRGSVYEVRPKLDADRLVAALQAAGMDCHATDEDVMRVFVPEGLTAQAVFEGARASASSCGTCARACPRSKTCFARAVGEE